MAEPDPLALHERALAEARRVIALIEPAQMTLPTPCAEFTVRDILDHLIRGNRMVRLLADDAPFDPGERFLADDDDALEAFDRSAEDAIEAFSRPGALDRPMAMPWFEVPGSVLLGFRTGDAVMHAWDLQTALGQTRDVDPELCRRVLEEARATLVPEFRGDGLPFGAEVAVAADAPIADQMAAFMGRAIPA